MGVMICVCNVFVFAVGACTQGRTHRVNQSMTWHPFPVFFLRGEGARASVCFSGNNDSLFLFGSPNHLAIPRVNLVHWMDG